MDQLLEKKHIVDLSKAYIDLHMHTTASDGSLSPRQLVQEAKNAGLSIISVTDHDTIDGINEALEAGEELGVTVIPGIEISTEFKPEMHILGYFRRENCSRIEDVAARLVEYRNERNPKIILKLNELGLDISMDEVKRASGGEIVGRPHFAMVLKEKGYAASLKEAFEVFLGTRGLAYFKKEKLTPEEGIMEIKKADGVAILAHPGLLGIGRESMDEFVGHLVEWGLGGIEVYYPEHDEELTQYLERLAVRLGIIATGGSDFHGALKDDIRLGVGHGNLNVPVSAAVELIKALHI
ncbi:MAG: PHP domain-containing protein [Clostridiales bacterium]|nr:PHP domain-containing protein [Clostridiales bacterium]